MFKTFGFHTFIRPIKINERCTKSNCIEMMRRIGKCFRIAKVTKTIVLVTLAILKHFPILQNNAPHARSNVRCLKTVLRVSSSLR